MADDATPVMGDTSVVKAPEAFAWLSAEMRDIAVLALFFSAILLGVWRLGSVSLPVWFFILPLVLWRFPPSRPHFALVFVLIVYLGVAVQMITGHMPGREDAGVYLPFVCTVICLTTLTGVRISGDTLYRALMLAGLFLCVSIAVGIANRCGSWPIKDFYMAKALVATPLGRSNYLGVFLVFFFNVALYKKSPLSLIFAAFTVLTLSKTAVFFLGISGLVWLAWLSGRKATLIGTAAASVFAISIILHSGSVVLFSLAEPPVRVLFEPVVNELANRCTRVIVTPGAPRRTPKSGTLPGELTQPDEALPDLQPEEALPDLKQSSESISIRSDLLSLALPQIAAHPMFGVPRSEFRRTMPDGHYWAHGWPLDITLLLGLFGLVAYLAYLGFGLFSMPSAVPWPGVRTGIVLTILWGITEIVLLTPAYETLFAALIAIQHKMSHDDRLQANTVS